MFLNKNGTWIMINLPPIMQLSAARTRGLTPVLKFHSFLSSGHTCFQVSRISFFFASSVSFSLVFVNLSWNEDEPDLEAVILILFLMLFTGRCRMCGKITDGTDPLRSRFLELADIVRKNNDILSEVVFNDFKLYCHSNLQRTISKVFKFSLLPHALPTSIV